MATDLFAATRIGNAGRLRITHDTCVISPGDIPDLGAIVSFAAIIGSLCSLSPEATLPSGRRRPSCAAGISRGLRAADCTTRLSRALAGRGARRIGRWRGRARSRWGLR